MFKVLVVFLISSVFFIPTAFAFLDFSYTNQTSTLTDGYKWVPIGQLTFFGGPAANNLRGGALQFLINSPTYIDYLTFDAKILGGDSGLDNTNNFSFNIYNGSTFNPSILYGPIPDFNKLVHSKTVSLPGQVDKETFYSDVIVPFDTVLAPGEYWISQERGERGSPMGAFSRIQYHANNDSINAVATPEPSTYLLFAFGLMIAGYFRFKRANAY